MRQLQSLELAERNQAFLDAESKVDRAIQIRQPRRVSVWRTMVGRGAYELGQGLQKKAYRFHPGIGPQRGLDLWKPIQISRKATAGDPGYDATQYNPYTVNYGFDSVTYGGLSIEYNTPNISIRDLRFSWEIKQQLSAVYGYLGDFTNDLWENYHREQYLSFVNAGSKLYVIGEGQPNAITATYNPLAKDSDGDNVLTIASYQAKKVGILNWKWNKWYSRHLQMQSPMASIGSESGRPAFGWVGDLEDFDRMIEEDPQQREDWRQSSKSDVLITGYGKVTEYKGFILMHDLFTPRFSIKKLDGDDVILKRVNPFVESAADLIGIRNDVNPAYLNAEFGMYIIYLKDVFMTEIPPSGPTSPGGGTSFGATPGLNGDWRWLNIQDAKENPLNEIGFWFMRAEAFAKPLENREEGIAVIYRRFVHNTPMDTELGGDLAEAEQSVAVDAVAGDLDSDLKTITLTLAGYLTAEAGDPIILTDDDGLTDVGIIADSSNAPEYLLALDTATSAFGKYTAAGGSKVTSS